MRDAERSTARVWQHDLARREPGGAWVPGQLGCEDHEHVSGAVEVAVPKFADACFWAAGSIGRPWARRARKRWVVSVSGLLLLRLPPPHPSRRRRQRRPPGPRAAQCTARSRSATAASSPASSLRRTRSSTWSCGTRSRARGSARAGSGSARRARACARWTWSARRPRRGESERQKSKRKKGARWRDKGQGEAQDKKIAWDGGPCETNLRAPKRRMGNFTNETGRDVGRRRRLIDPQNRLQLVQPLPKIYTAAEKAVSASHT